MNFLIDESENKLILQVFCDIQKSLDYSLKASQKTQEELFNQIFGFDNQPKSTCTIATKTNQKPSSDNQNQQPEQQQEQYQRISRQSQPIKLQLKQKQPNTDLLQNTKTLSNIHLRHMLNSFLKSECKKIKNQPNNYSCKQIQNSARNLLLNFFLRYTLIFEELQTMKSCETIEKQLKKSLSTIYVEIFCLLFQKGFRSYLTILKMILRIWLIASYIQNDNFTQIKREIKSLLGINIEFLLEENDKLTYQLAFKLKGMVLQANFDYEKEKKRRKQEKLKRKNQKMKKKIVAEIQMQKNKNKNKNVKQQTKIILNQFLKKQLQTKQNGKNHKIFHQRTQKNLRNEEIIQKIKDDQQKMTNIPIKIDSLDIQKPTSHNFINLQEQEEQKQRQKVSGQKIFQKNDKRSEQNTQQIKLSDMIVKDQKLIDTLRQKLRKKNNFKQKITDSIKKQ